MLITVKNPTYADCLDAIRAAAKTVVATARKKGHKIALKVEASPGVTTAAVSPDGITKRGVPAFTLHLPVMPLDARLPRKDAERLTGLWLHEISHILYTDFTVWNECVRAGLSRVVNALEDPRIERCAIRDGLSAVYQRALNETVNQLVPADYDPQKDPAFALAVYGRSILIGYEIDNLPALDTLPDHFADWVRDIIAKLDKCRNTQDVFDLAKTLRLPKPPKPQKDDNEQDPRQNGQGQGQDAQGEQDADDNTSDSDPRSSTSQGDQNEQDADEQDDNAGGNGEQDDNTSDSDQPSGTSQGDQNEQDADEQDDNAGGNGKTGQSGDADEQDADPMTDDNCGPTGLDASDIMERAFDQKDGLDCHSRQDRNCIAHAANMRGSAVRPVRWNYGTDLSSYNALKASLGNPARVKRDVNRLVKSLETTTRARGQKSGRFDARRLTRAMAGSENVYTRKTVNEGQTTAVTLLIDLSSSMSGGSLDCAKVLAIHMSEAFAKAGVPFEISGFEYGAGHGTNYVVFKDFKDRFSTATKARVALAPVATGYTSMSGQILTGARRLAAQDADRRLMIVLCDGDENYVEGVTLAMCGRVKAQYDVDVVGLGCLTDASERFPICQNVFHLNDLVSTGLETLVTQLRKAG